jgi:ring-1,2-phenylacetyl-CoA epoxidase subunit PaaD
MVTPRELVDEVPDPEMPWVTLGDLGVVRSVDVIAPAAVRVVLTPTYLGCPATEAIRQDVATSLRAAGWRDVQVELTFTPAWTPEMITARGRARLTAAGIAPPPGRAPAAPGESAASSGSSDRPGRRVVEVELAVRCPRCGSTDNRVLSRFGASPCQELRRCAGCREPFPAVRAMPANRPGNTR